MRTCQFVKNYIENAAAVFGLHEYTSSTEFTVKVKDKVFSIHPAADDDDLVSFNSPDNGDSIIEIRVSDKLSIGSIGVNALCGCIDGVLNSL